MTTLSISPAFANQCSAPRRPAAVRLTRRGRLVLVLGFLALALALMTVFGGLATATHGSGTPEQVRVLQIGPGDTLYGIAGRVAKPGHVREMVRHIQELNSLPGSSLQVGQQLAVPRG
ncbi:MAG: LysM peptidoglycan-binding domain-containing protein [Actinomycetota bacterium]|nr:LysM peptidoglycan-binding domain-containing protein [Actinomycetota bacterium]